MQQGATFARRYLATRRVDYDVPGVETWLARDTRLGTEVYVHIVQSLAPSVVRAAAADASALREPRVARVLATGKDGRGDDAVTYVVVAKPRGVRLDSVLERHRIPRAVANTLVGEIATALLKTRGRHHGLIRPSAISVDKSGRAVLSGFGIDGELATQARIGSGHSERADALALGRIYVAAITGKDIDDVTEGDIPEGLTATAAKMCGQVVRGTGPRTLAAVLRAVGTPDARLLRGFPARVATFPLRDDVAEAEALAAAEAERLAAAERERRAAEIAESIVEGEDVDTAELDLLLDARGPLSVADIVIDHAALERAQIEAADRDALARASDELIAQIEAELQEVGVPPLTEEDVVRLKDLYTFDYMVAEQNAAPAPSVWEAVLERLHERYPASEALTRRLEAAHERAQRPAPINAGPLVMSLAVVAVVVGAILAFSWFQQPIEPDFDLQNHPQNTYPEFTFTPPAEGTVSPEA